MPSENPLNHLFSRDLIFVTGKGGTGKTTVAATLGLAAARVGKRTLIYELGQERQLHDLFAISPRGTVEDETTQLTDGLYTRSIVYESAMRKWLAEQLRVGPIVDFVASSSSFQSLFEAAPGAREIVCWREIVGSLTGENRFDLVIIDAPASGHGFGMLQSPSRYATLTQGGPIYRRMAQISQLVADSSRTAVISVTQPSELPVNEAIELHSRLEDELELELAAIFVNELYERKLSSVADQISELEPTDVPALTAAAQAARSRVTREKSQQRELKRLRSRTAGTELFKLPFLFERTIGLEAISKLADRLER